MRFIEDGPVFPNELLTAQDEGRVVFFCGSGVSMAYTGLPNFDGLAEQVLTDLGAAPDSEAVRVYEAAKRLEEDANVSGLLAADRIFSLLARSFDQKLIHESVARILKPKDKKPNTIAHEILLGLAKQKTGHTRLVTTNFDRLFEQADPVLNSCTRSNLPHVNFDSHNWGIVHLHGRVNTDSSAPDQDGFVLSSAEFGDAYLAQGWARSFVQDILQRFTAVFVGYSADDPPIRYLLEGLMQSRGTLGDIYAFQAGEDDEAIARWDEKGVRTITYDPRDKHKLLWNSLREWSARSDAPLAWRETVFRKARRGPEKLAPHERGMVAHIVSSESGAKSFRNANPPLPATWLCVFDRSIRFSDPASQNGMYSDGPVVDPYDLYSLDDDPPPIGRNDEFSAKKIPPDAWSAFASSDIDRAELSDDQISGLVGHWSKRVPRLPKRMAAIGEWIVEVADQPASVWWAASQGSLHPDVRDRVNRHTRGRNPKKPIPRAVREGWRLVFEVADTGSIDRLEQYDFKSDVDKLGWNGSTIRQFAKIAAPSLESKPLYRGPLPPSTKKGVRLRDLISVSVEYPDAFKTVQIPDTHLAAVIEVFRPNVEKAIDLEKDLSGWVDVCAIEPDEPVEGDDNEQFHRHYKLSGYVIYFTSLFRRLVQLDAAKAANEYKRWRSGDVVFARLRFWAAGMPELASGTTYAAELLGVDRKSFWDYKGQRDLLLTLARRWNVIPLNDRKKIEKRILLGPKRYKNQPIEEHKISSAHLRLNVLYWLHNQGCEFSFNFEETIEPLREKAPDWLEEYAESAAESTDGRSGSVKTNTDWSELAKTPISEIVTQASKLQSRRVATFIEQNPFAGLCEERPVRALRALLAVPCDAEFSARYWRQFLHSKKVTAESPRINLLLAARISEIDEGNIPAILHSLAQWFQSAGPYLRDHHKSHFEKIWTILVNAIQNLNMEETSSVIRGNKDPDWASEAINSPAGYLTQLHMTDDKKKGLNKRQIFPNAWLDRVKELISLPEFSRQYALTIFAFNLNWFFYIDPEFAESHLISVLENASASEFDKGAIWSGFFWGAQIPQAALYDRLKPMLLQMARRESPLNRRHGEILSGLLLSGWRSKGDSQSTTFISNEEFRAVLLNSTEEFRNHILWQLERWSSDQDTNWPEKIVEFLTDVWPKQKKARTPRVSARLCDLAFSQKRLFPEIAKLVAELVEGVENEHLYLPSIRDKEGANVRTHPKSTLDLLFAILPEDAARWPYGAAEIVRKLKDPEFGMDTDPKLIELLHRLNDA
ncbi:MAG: hypothetical protein GXP04_12220 [Alphaproteobacteria bacterium]|nr:hypothetical protein [Alphaproteobacteria bacterium]